MTTTIVLDATTNSEVKKYVNNIKSYKVTELLFAIENYAAESQEDIFFDLIETRVISRSTRFKIVQKDVG